MEQNSTRQRVSAADLSEGDVVTVYVNSRATEHLGRPSFEATVESTSFGDIVFRPTERLQEQHQTHTWYSDIGYIHGHHSSLGRYSDIGKVAKVEK